jgi:hypothetical protein
MKIPECHIMKRWTIKARDETSRYGNVRRSSNEGEMSRTLRHMNLYMRVLDLVSVGEYDETTSEIAIKYLEVARTKIAKYKCTISHTCQVGYNVPAGTSNMLPSHMESGDESGDTGHVGCNFLTGRRIWG